MEYKDIISISNMGGLYSLVTTKADGAIVTSLDDGTKKFVSGRKHEFTPLDSIEVYTHGSNVPLSEIFIAMDGKADQVEKINPKKASADELYSLMSEIYPDLDTDRVYPSDIKKMIRWFDILKENGIIEKLEESKPTAEEEEE